MSADITDCYCNGIVESMSWFLPRWLFRRGVCRSLSRKLLIS